MRVRLIDGMNCTPVLFREKPLSRELTVPVLETILPGFRGVWSPGPLWRLTLSASVGRRAIPASEGCVSAALNMGSIVPGGAEGVVSLWFRFFSVCFGYGGMQRRRNIRCIRHATG